MLMTVSSEHHSLREENSNPKFGVEFSALCPPPTTPPLLWGLYHCAPPSTPCPFYTIANSSLPSVRNRISPPPAFHLPPEQPEGLSSADGSHWNRLFLSQPRLFMKSKMKTKSRKIPPANIYVSDGKDLAPLSVFSQKRP